MKIGIRHGWPVYETTMFTTVSPESDNQGCFDHKTPAPTRVPYPNRFLGLPSMNSGVNPMCLKAFSSSSAIVIWGGTVTS